MRKIGADAALALGYGRSAPFTQCQGSTPRGVWTSDVHGQRTDRKGDILTLDKRGHFNFGLTDPSKYLIRHEYFVKEKDGYLITHAKFDSYLDRVFKNHGLFVENVLIPILLENR